MPPMADYVPNARELHDLAQFDIAVHELGGRCQDCTANGCSNLEWAQRYVDRVVDSRLDRED